jgi:hypothetical protein
VSRHRTILPPLALTALLGTAAAASAANPAGAANPAEPATRPTWQEDKVGTYVIRPGDTLEEITRRFLGTPRLWRSNWKLNPSIRDPHHLQPGSRIQVILERRLPSRTAEIRQVSNHVDQKPQPNDWTPAHRGDVLQERDGVRTFANASANLGFDDGSSLLLTEDSLVFLRNLSKSPAGLLRQSVEVERGQADFNAPPLRAPKQAAEVEIVLGGATVRPTPSGPGGSAARTRRPAAGGAQVMVYGGQSTLSAGGAAVALPPGTGSSAPEGGAPLPPEKLLPAVRLISPAPGTSLGYANPAFRWQKLAEAASYTLEVCGDAACHLLVGRKTGLATAEWVAPSLPVGNLFARVTAVSRSGLDGFPGAPVPFTVTTEQLDREVPVLALARVGPGASPASGPVVLGPGGGLVPWAVDDLAGVAEIRYRWDGGAWSRWKSGPLTPPGPGTHRLEAQALDRLGRVSATVRQEVRAEGGKGAAAP